MNHPFSSTPAVSLLDARHHVRSLASTLAAFALLSAPLSVVAAPAGESRPDVTPLSASASVASFLLENPLGVRPVLEDILRRAANDDTDAQSDLMMLLLFDQPQDLFPSSDTSMEEKGTEIVILRNLQNPRSLLFHDAQGRPLSSDKLSHEARQQLAETILQDSLDRGTLPEGMLRLFISCAPDEYTTEIQPFFPGQAPPRPFATIREFFDFVFHRGLYWIWSADVWIAFGLSRGDILEAYEKAASTGDETVAQALADFYEGGTFAEANAAGELKWRRVCSDAHSAYRLGCLYATAPDRCLPAPNGAVAARHFARAEAMGGEDAISARNALLCRALQVQPSLVPIPLDDLAQRQASALEDDPDAFFAPMLLAAKALLDGDEDKAREWVSLSAEQGYDVAVAALRDWEAIVSPDKEKPTPFVEAMRRFLGVADTPDWDVALSVALPAAERGDIDSYDFAWRLLDCNWWEGHSLERRRELTASAARAGLSEASRDMALDEFWKAWSWEKPKAALATLGPEVDSETSNVLRRMVELMDSMRERIHEMMADPPSKASFGTWSAEMQEIGLKMEALGAEARGLSRRQGSGTPVETADAEKRTETSDASRQTRDSVENGTPGVDPPSATASPRRSLSPPPPPTAEELFQKGRQFLNRPESFPYFFQAAQMGHVGAQNNLASCYFHGTGTAKDHSKANFWWRKAAASGNLNAMYNLGHAAMVNERPTAESVRWWTQAAERGHVTALRDLGKCYEYGIGVNRDQDKARNLYRRAAALGDTEAKQHLSKLSGSGPSVDDSRREAVRLLE